MPVTYVEYDGMIHGFYWMQGIADGAKRLHADLAEAIARCEAALKSADRDGVALVQQD